MWDLIVSIPDHCLSFNFTYQTEADRSGAIYFVRRKFCFL